MADVFISYSRENLAFAQRLAEAVARTGYSVWWDRDLPPHLSYGKVITETIGAAKAAIVIWSESAAESEWVRAEADLARTEKKLIQTSIDDRMPPMPFNQIQYASIGDWNGEADHPGWLKVKASLAALCGPARAGAGAGGTAAAAPSRPGSPPGDRPRRTVSGPQIVAAVVALALVVVAVAGAILWSRRGEPAQADEVASEAEPAAPAGSAQPVPAPPPRGARALFTEAAVIDDPDGYTNLRSGPSANFAVLARINRGEVFTTYPQAGDWWQVRTADGRVGYMARSRIRTIGAGTAAAASDGSGLAGDGDGEAMPAAAPSAAAPPPQILPDSGRRRLTQADVAGLSAAQIRLARNEIFARHGRPFRDPRLRRHFELYPWYNPRPGPIALSQVEEANVRLLQQAEPKR